MDKLSAMRSFRRIVELGSFRAAATDRGLSNAGVSKQIFELEAELGASLLTRTTRKMALTEAGQTYFERCVRILDDIAESEAAVSAAHSAPSGLLRVSAPMSLGLLRVMDWIPDFMRAHPNVRLDLVLDDRAVDLVEQRFDVAIRVRTKLTDSTLIAKRIGAITRLVCASPEYLSAAGQPAAPSDLIDHRALIYSLLESPTEWPLISLCNGTAVRQRVVAALSINNSIGLRDAALAHLGIVLIPDFIVADELRQGSLVNALPGWTSEEHSLFVLYPSSRHLSPKVRAFVDFIASAAAEPSALGGAATGRARRYCDRVDLE